jgi:transcriptional regulator with XRE-family HTH domain
VPVVRQADHQDQCRAVAQRIGYRLRLARARNGLSQEQVAFDAGIAVQTYSKLERGEATSGGYANPTIATLLRILEALSMEPTELVARPFTSPLAIEVA